jgi:CheY-like chemotaxis protein/anti-sigma regulatory factor (Ser/Thr protein kinase)
MNAKDKAEASDHLKTAFINNISHEIRTPLNGILGFAPFIIQSDITMEEKEEYLENLNFSSDRLMNTLNDIMDISLIISGNMEVHPQPIDISLLLTNVFENFQEPSMKKNLELKMQFPDNVDNYILNTDGELLRKAVSKLVDNSVKFTKEGSITLGFELINNEIEIFVKDTGQGIEKDSQELIYKSFMQENVSSTRGHEGSGLGLSISKGIMQLLGGEIRLESTKNMGTTVFLSLPNITSTVSSKPKNSTNAIKVGEMPLILIAEDDDSNYSYAEILLRKDSKILRANNGQEAVDLCKIHPDITLVLMDIKMPVMNGIEATHIIKSFRNDLPIIAVTAHAQSGDEFKIKEAGCDDYISKPINKTKLLSLIRKYFKK